jgi:hypothetical protein
MPDPRTPTASLPVVRPVAAAPARGVTAAEAGAAPVLAAQRQATVPPQGPSVTTQLASPAGPPPTIPAGTTAAPAPAIQREGAASTSVSSEPVKGRSERDLEELAQALFGRIRTRLRSELIHDREAKGLTFDNI